MNKKSGQAVPSAANYVKENGKGITDYGVKRLVTTLPALRAVADPDANMTLSQRDMVDIRACLASYRAYGSLNVTGADSAMWCDIDNAARLESDAVMRLSTQKCDNGSTKYRAVFQAVPLAMDPSRDLACEGYWRMLSSMAGYRNMDGHTDAASAGRAMEAMLDFNAGPGKHGLASKLTACWQQLDKTAPCILKGAESSVRAMQFCAMSNLAQLGGYCLEPDLDQARGIGRIVAAGFDDTARLRELIEKSLTQDPQRAYEKVYSPYDRLLDKIRSMDENDRGHDGNDGNSAPPCPGDDLSM